MGTDVDVGGEVESFETDANKIYGFGIEGEWDSEYIPSHNKYKFYTTIDGKRHKGDLLNKNAHAKSTMYPLVAALGEGGVIKISLSHMVEEPETFVKKYENKQIERGFMNYCALDDDGILSPMSSTNGGFFVSHHAASKTNNVFSFKVLQAGQKKFCCGLSGYVTEIKDWQKGVKESVIFNAETNILNINQVDKKDMMDAELSEGDTITITVNFTTETFCEVDFKHQQKSVS
ncbi:uncharacterized protein LOC117330121 [Pecten maximus]|uniref:uncharacterized protein LOC117330121 n=1 Tax=Pecten maximus TaxID=6579 RepID=UPI00145835A7|nr:uncharacterized protein LOC117330121 [Pecten maximus]